MHKTSAVLSHHSWCRDLENQHGLSKLRPGANNGQQLGTPTQDPQVFNLCPETMLTFYFWATSLSPAACRLTAQGARRAWDAICSISQVWWWLAAFSWRKRSCPEGKMSNPGWEFLSWKTSRTFSFVTMCLVTHPGPKQSETKQNKTCSPQARRREAKTGKGRRHW